MTDARLPQTTVDLFCEVAASGVVHQAEPPGIDYVTVQVDMDTWRGIQAWAAGLSEGAAPLDWECGQSKDGYQCSRPAGHKGMHRKRLSSEGAAPLTCKRCGHHDGCSTRCCMNQAEPCQFGAAPRAEGLDVTDRDAVLDRLHNDPAARYFYELGKAAPKEHEHEWHYGRCRHEGCLAVAPQERRDKADTETAPTE